MSRPSASTAGRSALAVLTSMLLALGLMIAPAASAAEPGADDPQVYPVNGGNGLVGISFDIADVEFEQSGTTITFAVPAAVDTVKATFHEDERISDEAHQLQRGIVSLHRTTGSLIQPSAIASAGEQSVDLTEQGASLDVHAYVYNVNQRYRYGATYTVEFTRIPDGPRRFRVSQPVGERRHVVDRGAPGPELSVRTGGPQDQTVTHQWQRSTDGDEFTDIDGANDATFVPPTDEIGRTMYRVAVSNGAETLRSGRAIVDVQDPQNPSPRYALGEVRISQSPDDPDPTYLNVRPWQDGALDYEFTITDNHASDPAGEMKPGFHLYATTADERYDGLRQRFVRGNATAPMNNRDAGSGIWAEFSFTRQADPVASVHVGPDARALGGSDYTAYHFHARIRATLKDLVVDDTLTPAFDPEVFEYSAELPADQTSVTITAPATFADNPVTIGGIAADENGAVTLPLPADGSAMQVPIVVGVDDEEARSLASTYTLTLKREQSSEAPAIAVHPKGASYLDTESAPTPLRVRAHALGDLSYQWFETDEKSSTGGTAVDGATSATFTPSIAPINTLEDTSVQEKTTYYYVEVTAGGTTVASKPAPVTLTPDPTPSDIRVVNADGSEPPAEGFAYRQGDTATHLTVRHRSRSTGGTWAYRWRTGLTGRVQTTQVFEPPLNRQATMNVSVDVTYTVDGVAYEAKSANSVPIVVTATSAAAPTINSSGQPQDQLEQLHPGDQPRVLRVRATSPDSGVLSYQWFRRTSEDGTFEAIEGATADTYQPPTQDEPGSVWYRARVTNEVTSYTGEIFRESRDSAAARLDFTAKVCPVIDLDGTGTPEDPFELEDSGDLAVLQSRVNDDELPFENCHFEFTDDLTLPQDWQTIGDDVYFSGTIDGRGHTLTVPVDGLPLLGSVRRATVRNLDIYGERIAGYGLVNQYRVDSGVTHTIDIDNVTLKSGSSTLQSGFIGGYASGINQVNITDSTIERDVVIGYDKARKGIGSFAGALNGTIANSVSHATVYGVDMVGGLVGVKGQSMGTSEVFNSQFHGTVVATGDYVGGIMGSGYDGSGTAPNTPAVTIRDTLFTGSVTGADKVGGILGGEPGVEQAWANGIGWIQNNLSVGQVSGSGAHVGGVIGYLNSLNRFMVVSTNVHGSTGASRGIGSIRAVDRTSDRFGRDDDPAGADADKLARQATAQELADGTVTDLLNAGRNSSGTWQQGETHPERGTGTYLRTLQVSGYPTRPIDSDVEPDFSDVTTTVTYSDGRTEPVSGVTYSGFVLKRSGHQTITASYTHEGIEHIALFEVNARPANPGGPQWRDGACQGTEGVTVVVDYGAAKPEGADQAATRCALGDPADGLSALESAGFSVNDSNAEAALPGTVCTINAVPAQGFPSCWTGEGYWSYWHSEPGRHWTYSDLGAGNRKPAPGSVDGWRWSPFADPTVPPVAGPSFVAGQDTTAPVISVVTRPASTSTSSDARVDFTVDDLQATIECRLDAREWRSCPRKTGDPLLPMSFEAKDLRPGAHTIEIRATDRWDNVTTERIEFVRTGDAQTVVTPTTTSLDRWSPARPVRGRTVTATGRVVPGSAGTTVVLQRRSGSTWIEVGRATTDARGRYSVRATIAVSGKVRLRAVARARGEFSASASATETVTVLRPTTTSISVRSKVKRGSAFEVRGSVKQAERGTRVRIQRQAGNRWVTVSSTRTKARGVYRTRVRLGGTGRVRIRAVAEARGLRAASESRVRTVTVLRPTTTRVSAPSKVVRGKAFTVRGTVAPAVKDTRVRVQRRVGNRWVTVSTTRTDARGVYRTRVRLGGTGRVRIRTVAEARGLRAASVSRVRTVTVRR